MSPPPPPLPRHTLLLVFLHGFKGTDHTFLSFPQDLRALLAHTLPRVAVRWTTYPQYDTRGDLAVCVRNFRGWLSERVAELKSEGGEQREKERGEAGEGGGGDASVRVVLCGHSMGGIVAAETLLSIARADGKEEEEIVQGSGRNATVSHCGSGGARLAFEPYIQGVLAFDTPYLGISPGVLAHGAEEQFNHASTSYKAFDAARSMFGWGAASAGTAAPAEPIAEAAEKGLPAPDADAPASTTATTTGGGKWGKWAMYGGAAAAIAGAAGAAYMSWNQINDGLAWATSHLEFVGCLARSAELQKRVESVVSLTKSHGVGFADYYTALGEKAANKTKYAGAVLGESRTFCVVPRESGIPMAAPTDASGRPPAKRQRGSVADEEGEQRMREGEQVQQFAKDRRKDKGTWVKCVNDLAPDEVTAHQAMFTPAENSGYYVMLPQVRDQIVEWVMVDSKWYQSSGGREEAFDIAEDILEQGMGEGTSPPVSVD
nr:hypothetical protein CFP56_03022 [Quercus suber]